MRFATPDYFKAMGISLLRGRYFEPRDTEGAPLVAIIDETLAQTYWPNQDPIGKRLHAGSFLHCLMDNHRRRRPPRA